MARMKTWLACIMAAMLLFSAIPAYAEELITQDPSLSDGSVSADASASAAFVRIKNKWQSNYLYEGADGTVRYGMTATDDETSHWQLETVDGHTRIQNRATGHYITVAETAKRKDALKARSMETSGAADQWLIEAASRPGYSVIKSATAPSAANLVIHEEDQLGYAEVSNDINVTFESPQWLLEPVQDQLPVRIVNEYRAGQFLYETSNPDSARTDDIVAYGNGDPTDPKGHWYLDVEPGKDGGPDTVRVRNRATGKYLQQFDGDNYWRGIEAVAGQGDEASLQWTIQDAKNEDGGAAAGYVTLASAGNPAYVLNTQFEDKYARSNDWSNGGRANAHWKIVPAYDVKPVRIVNYTTAAVGTDYLYEDSDGSVSHGALGAEHATDPLYQWLVEDYDGTKRIRNASTGHYLTAGDPLTSQAVQGGAGTNQWQFTPSDAYDDYMTIQSAADPSVYVQLTDGIVKSGTGNPDDNAVQWMLEDPAAAGTDGAPQYVRIQNDWQTFVWYEDANGDLKYGNVRNDQRDQWLVEKYQGRKRIKNRATGHYVNLQDMQNGHIRVTAVQDDWSSAIWVIETTGSGSKLIYSVNDRVKGQDVQKLINLQNLTKYAEYAAVNRNWGSPRWTFVPVSEAGPSNVQLVNKQGQALYEGTEGDEKGKVLYGSKPASDTLSVWFLEDAGSGAKRLKNLATGHYIAMENMAGQETEDAPTLPLVTESQIYDSWGSAKWYLDSTQAEGYSAIRSGWAGHYIYTDAATNGTKVSKTVKQDNSFDDSALFKVEAVTSSQALPDGFIRIQNNNQYLYENRNGVILYGSVAADNGYSHWTLETVDGVTRMKNRVTGHVAAMTGDYRYLVAVSAGARLGSADQWAIESSPDGTKWLIRSKNGNYADEYVNVQNNAGYAERGMYPVSYGSLQWSFEAAPSAFVTPEDGTARNDFTATPVQDDTGYVTIGNGNALLSEQNGRVLLSTADPASEAAQWLQQDFNGRKLLKNRATGRLLALGDGGNLQTLDPARLILPEAQWRIVETLGSRTWSNASQPEGKVIHRDLAVGYETSASDADTRWTFKQVAGDMKYEAENAFLGGHPALVDSEAGFSGKGYVSGWAAAGDKISFAVNAQAEGTYDAVIRYRNHATSPQALSLYLNGLRADAISFQADAEDWTDLHVSLNLRAGINAVTLQVDGDAPEQLLVDALTVKNTTGIAYRGATTPYTTYEAEQAVTNATILEPSRVYHDLASEASGRQAVTLEKTGDYIEFTLAKQANSIVLRYAIPDSQDGSGQQATLGLYVNGNFRQKLDLTSKYAWEYGSYPWSNDPTQGSAHRFFDESHALIGDVPAGATIRLVKDEDSTAASYTVDLADFEQVADPYTMPSGFVSVTDYGAVADDGQDDTDAFKQAMSAAKAAGKGVWFPQGNFELRDGLLYLDQVTIRGAGMWYTKLTGAKFMGKGSNIQVYDLLIDGDLNERDDEAHTNAFEGGFGPGSVFEDVWIEHTKAGIWLTKLKDGEEYTNSLHMIGLRIRDLMADGINFCVGTTDSMMEQSDIRYPGDDGIAMWSTDRPSVNNTARFNTVSLPWLADNIVVFGGTDNKIQDNVATDTITNGAGLAVSTRFNPVPFAGTTLVERNTLIRTGSYDTGLLTDLGAIWLFADTKALDGQVVIRDNTALDSTYQGLTVQGSNPVAHVSLQNLVLDGMGTKGVDVSAGVSGSISVDNVILRQARIADVANASGQFSLNETGAGFAGSLHFTVSEGNGAASNRFTLQLGAQKALQVHNLSGEDVTAGATFSLKDTAIVEVDSKGVLASKQIGTSLLEVTYQGISQLLLLEVTASSSAGSGTGTAGASAGSRSDNDRILSGAQQASELVFDVGAASLQGEASFSAGALLKAAVRNPAGTLVIRNGALTYTLPLSLISGLLEARQIADPDAAVWTIKVVPVEAAKAEQLRTKAASQGLTLADTLAEYSITLEIKGKKEAVDSFGSTYVKRKLQVSGKVDPHTATALRYDEQTGKFEYVPAWFEEKSGVTEVTIFSTGNSVYAVSDHPVSFEDSANHWAKEEIGRLASKRIVKGKSDTAFGPDQSITRAEYATLLVRALGLRDAGGKTGFSDVADNDWYAQDVRTAAHYGLIQGFVGGTFHPKETITREQMAVMTAKALKLAQQNKQDAAKASAIGPFRDAADIHVWAADAVTLLTTQGIMQGTPAGTFAPGKQATRAEAVVILSRLLQAAGLMNP